MKSASFGMYLCISPFVFSFAPLTKEWYGLMPVVILLCQDILLRMLTIIFILILMNNSRESNDYLNHHFINNSRIYFSELVQYNLS